MSGPEELRALVDERGLEAAELELSRVLAEFDYVMPVDGMHRVLTAYLLTRAESSLTSPAGMEGDDPVTTVYGRLLWHHMDAMRKNDEPRRQRAFDAAQALREIWSVETQVWEDRYTPVAPRGESE